MNRVSYLITLDTADDAGELGKTFEQHASSPEFLVGFPDSDKVVAVTVERVSIGFVDDAHWTGSPDTTGTIPAKAQTGS